MHTHTHTTTHSLTNSLSLSFTHTLSLPLIAGETYLCTRAQLTGLVYFKEIGIPTAKGYLGTGMPT